MLCKTQTLHAARVMEAIRTHHPYDTPAILQLDVAAGDAVFLKWITQETSR